MWTSTEVARAELRSRARKIWDLRERTYHLSAYKLGRKSWNGKPISDAKWFEWQSAGLTIADCETLGEIASSWMMARLEEHLNLSGSDRRNCCKAFCQETPHPHLGDAGVCALADGLRGETAFPMLRCLSLAITDMGDSAAQALAAAFCRGAIPHLVNLNVYGNRIGNTGLIALADSLRMLRPKLERLNLSMNAFDDEGFAAFVEAVPGAWPSLMDLTMFENAVTDVGCLAFASALKKGTMPALRQIDISGWHIRSGALFREADKRACKIHR